VLTRADGGEGAATSEPADGWQGSLLRAEDLHGLGRRRRPGLRGRWCSRRQSLPGIELIQLLRRSRVILSSL
jgi:hypothetical protein